MQRIFSYLNGFNFVFLLTAITLGYLGHPKHVLVGLFADLSAIFAFCLALAIFVGLAKYIKEHVGRYDLNLAVIDRLNGIFHPFFTTVLGCCGLLVVVGILGGTLLEHSYLARIHGILAIISVVGYGVGAFRIHRFQADLSRLLAEIADDVPETQTPGVPAEGRAKEGFVPDVVDWNRRSTRGRAWLASGVTLLVVMLHIEIAIKSLGWLWLPIALICAILTGLGIMTLGKGK